MAQHSTYQFCKCGDAPPEEAAGPDLPFLDEERGEDGGAQDGVVDEGRLPDRPQEDVEVVRRQPRAPHGLVGQVLVHHAAVSQVRVPRILKGTSNSPWVYFNSVAKTIVESPINATQCTVILLAL